MKRLFLMIVLVMATTSAGLAQSITYYFPQIAVGGGWQTTIFISNTMTSGTGTATIILTKSDGTPFKGNWVDEMGNNVTNNNNVIGVQLAGGESRKFTSVADVPLTTGFATITANSSAVLGTATFTDFDHLGHML